MDLDRYTELANKVLENKNPEQKHKGLSSLIGEVGNDLPDVITVEYRDLVFSNRTLRFDYYTTYILHQHDIGNSFRKCVNLLTQHRDEVEQWECDDEATIAIRQAKLKRYAQTERIEMPPQIKGYNSDGNPIYERPKHPDAIYCEGGAYRKFEQIKDSFYFRLGRMIQNTHTDNGDLKKTMKEVCLIVALNNERSIVEDELRLLGIIPDTNDKRAVCLKYVVEHINNDMSSDLHKSVANVVEFIGNQIGEYINSIGTVEYLDYIEKNILRHRELNIYGKGNPMLDETREGNLFFAIDRLRGEFIKVDPIQKTNGEYYRELCKSIFRHESNDDVIRELHEALVDFFRLFDYETKQSPIPPSNKNGNEIITRLNDVVVWCKLHHKDFTSQLATYPLVKDIEDLNVVATYVFDNFGKWSSQIRFNSNVASIFNNVGYLIDNAIEPTIKQRKPTSTPERTTAVEVEMPNTLTATSHNESIKPTISFNMSALYSFLIDEGVIENLNDKLFADCINQADIKALLNVTPSKNKLKLALQTLKEYYQSDIQKRKMINPTWYLKCCESVGLTPQEMSKMNFKPETKVKFQREMKKMISLP